MEGQSRHHPVSHSLDLALAWGQSLIWASWLLLSSDDCPLPMSCSCSMPISNSPGILSSVKRLPSWAHWPYPGAKTWKWDAWRLLLRASSPDSWPSPAQVSFRHPLNASSRSPTGSNHGSFPPSPRSAPTSNQSTASTHDSPNLVWKLAPQMPPSHCYSPPNASLFPHLPTSTKLAVNWSNLWVTDFRRWERRTWHGRLD